MITSIDATRAVCEYGDWEISNLALHKMLYIAHGTFMAEKGGVEYPLVQGSFHAWDYGPVKTGLYHKFKMFGADFIQEYALILKYKTHEPDEAKAEVQHIKKVIGWIREYTPSQLVAMTHSDGGAWEQHYDPDASNIIPNQDIYDEYKKYRKQ